MMIKNMKRAIVLGLTALVLFVAAPAPKALAADNAPVHTAVSISGKINKQVVTYRVNLDKRTVTDGRIAVTYDKDILTLIDDNEDRFDEKDVNKITVNQLTNANNKTEEVINNYKNAIKDIHNFCFDKPNNPECRYCDFKPFCNVMNIFREKKEIKETTESAESAEAAETTGETK